MTNLNKTKEEIIYELLLSLNQGDSYYVLGDNCSPRVDVAIAQYEYLVKKGIVTEQKQS